MKKLSNHIREYLELFNEVMIIDGLTGKETRSINKAIETTTKLIKKLKKGDRSVFRDPDDEEDNYWDF